MALVGALFGPIIQVAGPDGVVAPEQYIPVGLAIIGLFTPAFPLAIYVMPQYFMYAVPAYLLLRICVHLAAKWERP